MTALAPVRRKPGSDEALQVVHRCSAWVSSNATFWVYWKAVAVQITIHGASEHNLDEIDVEFQDGLTVVTGVSGSGKTSLVFDTLYHEARRRFLEVFSLGGGARLSPAKVRSITGLGPAVAVGQNLLNRNPASTLATASGLHPFLRLLYARFGVRHCARCGTPLSVLT